jgi:hypothetical protein
LFRILYGRVKLLLGPPGERDQGHKDPRYIIMTRGFSMMGITYPRGRLQVLGELEKIKSNQNATEPGSGWRGGGTSLNVILPFRSKSTSGRGLALHSLPPTSKNAKSAIPATNWSRVARHSAGRLKRCYLLRIKVAGCHASILQRSNRARAKARARTT